MSSAATSKSAESRIVEGKPKVETNPRGIPKAPFIANIEEHVGGPDAEVESTLRQFQEAIAKYRYMELNLNQRKKSLSEKVPDMEKTLSMVEFLRDRRHGKLKAVKEDEEDDLDGEEEHAADAKPLVTTFELNDTLYAEAELQESDEVYLWLGANVMLSYPVEEAIELLTSKLSTARQTLQSTAEDLEFLREQITVMEVNTARTFNWDVKRRRDRRLAGEDREAKG